MDEIDTGNAADIDVLEFIRDGAKLYRSVLNEVELRGIESAVAEVPFDRAGIRLRGIPELDPYLAPTGPIGSVAASVLGTKCHPVRAILFDKTPAANWSLGWHQDRTIAVKQRIEVEGFGPWTVKRGFVHVEPPSDLLAGIVTLRVHLDRVAATNAPLLIAPGSHRQGRIPVDIVPELVKRCGTAACLADRGDIWLYATTILHASKSAAVPFHRRVLQIDFAVGQLPAGLQWLGV